MIIKQLEHRACWLQAPGPAPVTPCPGPRMMNLALVRRLACETAMNSNERCASIDVLTRAFICCSLASQPSFAMLRLLSYAQCQ